MARPRHVVEYAALRAAAALFALLPLRASMAIVAAAGWILWLLGWRRREAVRRIRQALGCPPRDADRLARAGLVHFLWALVDALRARRISARWVRRHVVMSGTEHLAAATAGGRGVIVALAHLGSWEMAGIIGPLLDLPLVVVVARQRNPLVDRFILRWRQRAGTEIVPRGGPALRTVVSRLRNGRMLAIPVDLRAPEPGVQVRFLGAEANLGRGLGILAELAGVDVIPCAILRRGWTRHEIRFLPAVRAPVAEDRDHRLRAITQAVADALEPFVRRHPEQYFWYNRRWVLDPL